MTKPTRLSPAEVAQKLSSGTITLVDIRNPNERAREYIAGSTSAPIGLITSQGLKLEASETIVFHCRSGVRTDTNCDLLAAHVDGPAYVLEGGIEGWKRAGLPTRTDRAETPKISHRALITAGLIVLAAIVFGVLLQPAFSA